MLTATANVCVVLHFCLGEASSSSREMVSERSSRRGQVQAKSRPCRIGRLPIGSTRSFSFLTPNWECLKRVLLGSKGQSIACCTSPVL